MSFASEASLRRDKNRKRSLGVESLMERSVRLYGKELAPIMVEVDEVGFSRKSFSERLDLVDVIIINTQKS